MAACHYCGEDIKDDARLCRHCQRPHLYQIQLVQKLDDREKHLFFKLWQSKDKTGLRSIVIASYSQAKTDLDKLPVVLLWDLTRKQAIDFTKSVPKSFIQALEMKLQGGMPSTYEVEAKAEEHRNRYVSWLYGAGAVGILGLALFVGLQMGLKPHLSMSYSTSDPMRESIEMDEEMAKRHLPNWSIIPGEPSSLPPPTPVTPPPNFSSNQSSNGGVSRENMQTLLSATVFITDGAKLGSGFIISSDGYLLSNAHVTSSMERAIVILKDKRQFPAEKIAEDARLDISLLKISTAGLTALKLGDANQLYAGQSIITIGNPGGLSFTVTRGIVSFVGRNIRGVPFIQTDAAINRGNSGGPMINENLEVVGINTLTSTNEQGISFALPINFACDSSGMARRIGLQCSEFRPDQDPTMDQASFGSDSSEPKSKSQIFDYQTEANEYKAELMKRFDELKTESDRLLASQESLQTEYNANRTNVGVRERIAVEQKRVSEALNRLEREKSEAELAYLVKIKSLLIRQKGDPDYYQFSSQIEGQIAEVEKNESRLRNQLQ